MRTIYSIGARFAGGGIGTTAYHAVCGLHRHGLLRRLLCSSYRPSEIPASLIRSMGIISRILRRIAIYDPTYRITYFHDMVYDRWASRYVEEGQVFHAWGNYGLRCMQKAAGAGSITIVERASSHPLTQRALLKEEYTRWGLPFRQSRTSIQRSIDEIERADYILIPSDFVRRTFLEQGVLESKLLQVPFGADVERFRPSRRPDGQPFRVLFVGQVAVRKGVPYLLEAWRQLGWQDAELMMLGRVARDLEPLLDRYAGLPGVRFIGHVPCPEAAYQSADVFAFPTIEEGSALVTYEALACGLPVVTTPNAGSVVRDGIEGFIVPIRDVQALATVLDRLRADEQLRLAMARAARMRAESFTWQKYGDSLAGAYERLALQ